MLSSKEIAKAAEILARSSQEEQEIIIQNALRQGMINLMLWSNCPYCNQKYPIWPFSNFSNRRKTQ